MKRTIRVGINGFGRMGKLLLRVLHPIEGLEVVHINEPLASAEMIAHLLEFDTVHGRWARDMSCAEGCLSLEGQEISLTRERRIDAVPWGSRGVELLLDCSGAFKSSAAFLQKSGGQCSLICACVLVWVARSLVGLWWDCRFI